MAEIEPRESVGMSQGSQGEGTPVFIRDLTITSLSQKGNACSSHWSCLILPAGYEVCFLELTVPCRGFELFHFLSHYSGKLQQILLGFYTK